MKKDRLVITISDINSSKSYNVNKIIKKYIIWFLLIVFVFVGISSFTISRLSTSVNALSQKSKVLEDENRIYSTSIESKKKQIEELSNDLDRIESIIGLNTNDTASLIQRATLAKMTSSEKSYMLQTIPNGCPLKECETTSTFGWRIHPMTHKREFHKGIDLRAARRTTVYSTADGVVRYVQDKNEGGFGRVIIITHNFGFETLYAHLRFTDVQVGDVVKKGQAIGRSGNSGRSNGPHLHYQVMYASKVLDPIDFIKWNMKNYEEIFKKQRRVEWESLVGLISNQKNKLERP